MLRAAIFITACLFSLVPARVAAADLEATLTASEILHRAAIAQHITGANVARLGTITENGQTFTQLIVVKAPDRILIRNEYPWMHLVRYFGYDGKRAWQNSNFGGGGFTSPALERYIKSTLAWYTSADMIPGRWPVNVTRLQDRVVDGRSYFAIQELPEGGNPNTLLVDKVTYASSAVSSVPGRLMKCTDQPKLTSICRHEDVISGGKAVGSVDIQILPIQPEDWQFDMPQMIYDRTTEWLQQYYTRALGAQPSGSQTLRGDMHQVVDGVPTAFSTQWQLETTSPDAFALTQTSDARPVWKLAFNGTSSTAERLGQSAEAAYLTPALGMAFNHCEIHAVECNVRVTRLANVGLGERWYYSLGVTSLRDPTQWYAVLVDPSSGLPYALWVQDEIIYLENYLTSASGRVIPSKWTNETTTTTFEVDNVKEVVR